MNISLTLARLFSLSLITVLFFSCSKNGTPINNPGKPDFTATTSASVSGFVTDENDHAVAGATVQYGSLSGTTDKFGFFEFTNATVVKNAAVVTIVKPGYFNGIKTFIVTDGVQPFCRIKLVPKTTSGTINASTGGNVALSNGLKVALPANAVVTAFTKTAYAGVITVTSNWTDPTRTDLTEILPGPSWGIDKDGAMKALKSYGMAAVELTGSEGELLQLAEGKKATLTMPIPATMTANAPPSIPLWYLDEVAGYCKEEGTATKTGDSYVGEVAHFSFWYCWGPTQGILLKCRITDKSGNPLETWVTIKSAVMGAGRTWTNENGIIFDFVPSDVYELDVLDSICTAYSTPVSVANAVPYKNLQYTWIADLGDIPVPDMSLAVIKGTVTDCNNMPVSNGYAMFVKNEFNYRVALSNTGTFTHSFSSCGSGTVSLVAENAAQTLQGAVSVFNLKNGINDLGFINACYQSSQQFINYTIDGVNYSFSSATDKFGQDGNAVFAYSRDSDTQNINRQASIGFELKNRAAGASLAMEGFYSLQLLDTLESTKPGVLVNLTEYGDINEFIGGHFSGIITSNPPASVPHTITCSFRVRRLR